MQATLTEPNNVTRTGQPVSVLMPSKDCVAFLERGEDTGDVTWLNRATPTVQPETRNLELPTAAGASEAEALKRSLGAQSKEFVEKGVEVFVKA